MSVQLILYPQGHNGVYNTFTNPDTDFITNGINFTDLSNSPIAIASSIDLAITSLVPPAVPNSWYRYIWPPPTTLPYNLNGNLKLPSDIGSTSGVYQRMTDLTYGVQYEAIIDIVTPPQPNYSGKIIIKQYVGAQIQTWNFQIDETTTQIRQLIGQSLLGSSGLVDVILFVGYEENDTSSSNCTIGQIQVQPAFGQSGSVILDDGQVICDLYEDEDIPLSLSIDEFKNVAEKVQSYSKAFNLPATKRNNRIFDQVFEITRDIPFKSPLFNPYQRTQCVLKQDGLLLFSGYLRLLDITDKEGEISYNVNLYSEAIALADYLKDKTFSELDFTELEHDYNKNNIINSWNDALTGIAYTNVSTSGFRNAFSTVKYPFVNWNNQWVLSDGTNGTSGNPQLTSLEQAFRPWINIKYLIDRIFQNSPFTYSSTFFNDVDIKKLYMDFNWGADNAPVVFNSSGELTRTSDQSLTTSYTTLDFQNMFATIISPNFGYSSGVFTAQEDGQVYNISFNMEFETFNTFVETLDVEWVINGVANVSLYNQTVTDNGHTWIGNFTTTPLSAGDTVLCRAKSSGATMDLKSGGSFPFPTTALVTATTSSNQTTSDTLLGTLRGETGQWEFLKGLITMFNLVTLPDEDNPNNIVIEPYSDIFIDNSNSVQLDWTDKIDISEIKLEPLTDLNRKTIFKFVEDDDDSAFTQYKNQVGGYLYGSLMFDAGDEYNILEGTKEITAEPFAATVIKPLASQFSQFITPALYSYDSDSNTSEGFDNSPRIMYNNGIKATGAPYFIPAQNGLGSQEQSNYLQFSHIKDGGLVISAYEDFHFGACQLLTNQASTTNNLFNLYWASYIFQLYNINTRIMTIKVNLTPADVNTFNFYDTVFIKNRIFRVNKIEYKPNDLATVEFILIP